ncbi:hypothetical protein C5L31_001711 [Secundilactobacillus malefermentans]|uniref:Peptidase M10 metallopeptidase domain-containing protein n=1 Tax=Secundilactobacillus malefermentans TaxID=176292 RepID=A0A4R5NKN9_9LACO|nr:matrixin family metalloprotease [Secundilactobacillus malefermentans]KRM58749.1 hypothetical protein FD44_GL000371 [Secundilactobacillus malefermentans DSM 5705 = KCTC 3548]TDG75081.1 hypothetical protein C5L31_001711 [Secundilactobacillus malefermentans]
MNWKIGVSIFAAALMGALMTVGFAETVHAKTTSRAVTISQIKTKKTAQKYKKQIGKKYGINYAFQTGYSKTHRVYIYDATHSKSVGISLNRAMNDWNSRLGKKRFYLGTASHHSITIKFVGDAQTKIDGGISWWFNKSRTIAISRVYYNTELGDISRQMKKNYQHRLNPALSISDANLMIDKGIAGQARMVEFSRILEHEMGHTLGLLHSKSAQNLMYMGIGYGDIYQFDDVLSGKVFVNLVTNNDLSRAKAAIKMYELLH